MSSNTNMIRCPTVSEWDEVAYNKQSDNALGCPVCRKFIGSMGSSMCNDTKKIVFNFLISERVTRENIIGTESCERAFPGRGYGYFVRYVYWKHYTTPHTSEELHAHHSWTRIEMGENDKAH